jgi:dipeptidyl aminopeptidase/acylaminoacyl peptidase
LVELGMVGVQVDGRGTPFRSKAFHNYSYGRLENGGGLEDHLAAFRQIGATRSYLDLNRVGIFGHSGGGFASARAMFLYPDFYKVAVSSAGNHDQRGYLSLWGETYQGLPQGDNYAAQANPSIAKNLKGKLLLVFGDMDDNVGPALTLQVIDALTRANKSYDLMIVPNGSHAMMANMYFRRRRWDYFAEHLVGVMPPENYQIITPSEYPGISGTQP